MNEIKTFFSIKSDFFEDIILSIDQDIIIKIERLLIKKGWAYERTIHFVAKLFKVDLMSNDEVEKIMFEEDLIEKKNKNQDDRKPTRLFLDNHIEPNKFYGREKDIENLLQYINGDETKMLFILGTKGMGKTRLTSELVNKVITKNNYEIIVWKSILDIPPLEVLLTEIILKISVLEKETDTFQYATNSDKLLHLIHNYRCLIILDNFDALLDKEINKSSYRPEYKNYERLIKQIGESNHQSCFLINGRECPQNILSIAEYSNRVNIYKLQGLSVNAGKKLFLELGDFIGEDSLWRIVIEHYQGNPLMLRLISKYIKSIFFGNLEQFCLKKRKITEQVTEILSWHFSRLNSYEKEVMYILAINRAPMLLSEIEADVVSAITKEKLPDILFNISEKVLLETTQNKFFLQPVIIEFLTEEFICEITNEIVNYKVNFLDKCFILKATGDDYLREVQNRVLILPIRAELISYYKSNNHLIDQLERLLDFAKNNNNNTSFSGYTFGNVINLLISLNVCLDSRDFSGITISQAFLRDVKLQGTNFSNSDLSRSVFSYYFGVIISMTQSNDDRYLAIGTGDGDILIWDLSGNKILYSISAHSGGIWSVCFSYDNKYLASGGDDSLIKIWNFDKRTEELSFKGHSGRINQLCFKRNGYTLVSSSDDCLIKIWKLFLGINVNNYKCTTILEGHTKRVWSFSFTTDESEIISCSEDKTIRFWNLRSGKSKTLMSGHKNGIRTIAVRNDNKYFATAGQDKQIIIWDMISMRP